MRTPDYIDELEAKSMYLIREAYWALGRRLAILWSMGKDSTTLVHLARKAFLGAIPFPVIHIDTTFKFKEIYAFRNRYARTWGLDLRIATNAPALSQGMSPGCSRFACCNALKTEALKQLLASLEFDGLLVAIRRDEHAIRAKERFFSLRDDACIWDYQHQPLELWAEYFKTVAGKGMHLRIHPLLEWREIDVWRYVKRERLPVVPLYFAKKGQRYRSIGCSCCCQPTTSSARTIPAIIRELEQTRIAERAGRAQDKEKEYLMQKLRALGYM